MFPNSAFTVVFKSISYGINIKYVHFPCRIWLNYQVNDRDFQMKPWQSLNWQNVLIMLISFQLLNSNNAMNTFIWINLKKNYFKIVYALTALIYKLKSDTVLSSVSITKSLQFHCYIYFSLGVMCLSNTLMSGRRTISSIYMMRIKQNEGYCYNKQASGELIILRENIYIYVSYSCNIYM